MIHNAKQPCFTIDNFYIRPLNKNDLNLYLKRSSYPEINQNMQGTTKEEIQKSFERTLQRWQDFGFGRFAVFCKEQDELEFAGSCGLDIFHNPEKTRNPLSKNKNWDKYGGDFELSYWYLPKFWHQGLATRIGMIICKWALKEMDAQRIVAVTDVTNRASKRVLAKLGFTFVKNIETNLYGVEAFFVLQ